MAKDRDQEIEDIKKRLDWVEKRIGGDIPKRGKKGKESSIETAEVKPEETKVAEVAATDVTPPSENVFGDGGEENTTAVV